MRRLKREDCKHTKHDFLFSKWEILIGPNDWEDHASGKDGVERYRIHNLPTASSCSGLYELGVASIRTTESHRLRKRDWENVIVVYLGQADIVRTRLQEYGRSGSHLDHGNLIASRKNHESSSLQGHGLFKDIFSKGYSIMFRWAPIKSKMEAEKMEIELLCIFDYAWNRKGNGMCRHADILAKLIHNSLDPGCSPLKRILQWKQEAFIERMGTNIDATVPLFQESAPSRGLKGYLLPGIFKFSSSHLQFLPQDLNSVNGQNICGVATGHGSVCINKPLPGRKRCAEHKGKKITGIGSASRRMASSSDILLEDGTKGIELSKGRRVTSPRSDEICSPFQPHQSPLTQEMFRHDQIETGICGVVYGDGFVCRRSPVLGRKRCERHKGQRVLAATHSVDKIFNSLQLNNICGVATGHGSVCINQPLPGRKRCAEHKGKKITGIGSASRRMASSSDILPEDGTKEIELSKGRRFTSPRSDEICSPFQPHQSPLTQEMFRHDQIETGICGVVYGDGFVCRRSPVLGRKRCEMHKGQRVLAATPSVDKIFNSLQLNNICGVIDGNGLPCSRLPVPGRKRCEEHKGRRLVSA